MQSFTHTLVQFIDNVTDNFELTLIDFDDNKKTISGTYQADSGRSIPSTMIGKHIN